MQLDSSTCRNDNTFGPFVEGCRDDFDFTIVFEQSFFSIAPSAAFILLATFRILYLSRKPRILKDGSFQIVKLVAVGIYAILQFSLLVQSCRRPRTRTSIAAASLSCTCIVFAGGLSVFEYFKTLRSSILLNTYLFLSLLFDAVQTRTLWLAENDLTIPRISTAAMGVKFGLLILEAQGKEQWLPPGDYSPEETSGVFNMAFFGWLNNLLIVGYRKILSVEDLYALDQNLASGPIQSRFWRHWEDGESQTKSHKLLRTTLRTFTLPYLYPILPRVALIAFSFCRPFLINGILTYLENPDSASPNASYGFIGAAFFVYVGIAVSTGAYWYLHHRSLLMTRACLVSAIYQRTTQLSLSALNNSAAVTLMSTDIERIQNGMRDSHECWADLIEVALATWLLERQLGAACIAPIAVVLVCAAASIGMGKFTGKRQGTWMNNIQKRVGVTANAISNMTSLKMSGLTGQVTSLIQDLRTGEIGSAMRFRMFNVAASIMAFIPLLMLPVVTFAVTNRDLTVTRVFTSLSYLMLLSNPLTQLFQTFPQILAAIACFKRVERFLLSTSQRDTRTYLFSTAGRSDIRRGRLLTLDTEMSSAPACIIKNGNFGWVPGEYTLQNINMHIPNGQLSMIVGPVASGKSTLCKAFLGEIPFALGSTVFRTKFDQISFCDQSAFLVNTTIRKNILGQGVFNGPWYDEIIDATALMYDFDKLIDGDDTLVGTNGINLSGGQRHRIALARALYARPDLAIFDDIFSGLDLNTEEHVFRKVFGPQGILRRRKTTVVLCTQSIQHLPDADHIVALSADHTVVEEGKFSDLMKNKKYITSLGIQKRGKGVAVDTVVNESDSQSKISESSVKEDENDKARQLGDISVYVFYFSIIGLGLLVPYLLFGMAFSFLSSFSTIWLEFWSSATEEGNIDTPFYLGIYIMIQVLCLVMLTCFMGGSGIAISVKASTKLHSRAFRTLMNAPLAFFSAVDTGVTTNRFSQDMSMVDTDLSMALSNTVLTGFIAVGQAAIIATASPFIIIGYPVLIGVLYFIQKFYLRTSRQLRFLDLESKAPLYTHFLETLNGLATLRAFGWLETNVELNNFLLDRSQRPMYLLVMIQQWLNLVLNMTVAVLAIIVITLATQLRTTSSGFTGAGLVSLMSFGQMLTSLVHTYTLLETATGALSRLKSFSETVKSENLDDETVIPGVQWPSNGAIEIKGVSAVYEKFQAAVSPGPDNGDDVFVLRNIRLSIAPGEKIAICGRTGSGKSSLLLLLLRFLNPHSTTPHNISIDGLQLHLIHRPTLRSRLIAISQTPFLLPGGNTFRENLNFFPPTSSSSEEENPNLQDADYEYALQAVRLWNLTLERGGLDAELNEGSLSHGQRQLFCLARAILRARSRTKIHSVTSGSSPTESRGGGILLLDEINASVDRETDAFMQKVIREEFTGYTVLCVAHRLEGVKAYDRVVVMERGEIVESGDPAELMGKEGGRFRGLWEAGGR